ncbi:Nucleobase-ascorbate transporter 7 [Nymphaea thermarum]|nr:Nucleobase-ascorbate transporter 7 [Nymphaea thermarum]
MTGHKPQDVFEPFPVKEQLPGVDYCLTSPPPWHEAVFQGFQHFLVMLGTTVLIPTILVPQMGGGNYEKAQVIQTLLFVAGLNTLLQSFFGTRLPVVIGGSYTYILPTVSIIFARRYSYIIEPEEVVILIYLPSSSFIKFLSPLSAVPLVTLTGLGLYSLGFPGVAKCIEIGLPELILMIIFTQYVRHIGERRGIGNRYAVVFSIAVVWLYAHILTIAGAYRHRPVQTQYHCGTDRAGLIYSSPWIRVPYPFQWGPPTFNAGEVFAMMAASFAALIESTGTFIAASRYSCCTHMPPSICGRGVSWLGVGLLLDGMFGTANGSAASVENAGLLGMTRIASRRVIQISAGFMLFFAVLGKFGALFASIPLPIFAALYCILFAYVASAGLNLLQFCHLNSFRTKFILGFSLFMGLSVPQYFNEYTLVAGYGPVHTHGIWFNDMVNVIFSSPATVAAIVAYLLDMTVQRKHSHTRRDRGWHWWGKFRSFKDDPRSEEFYSLPYNLNKYFPPV